MNKLSKRSKIKFGVIGCGRIAQSVHLPLLSKMQNVEVEALADIDEQTLQLAGRLFPSAKKFHDYHELISTEGIDSVIISVPTLLHAEIAAAAIKTGKHIYLEKPLAGNIVSARKLLHAWRESGVVGMVGFNFRFNHPYQQMRDMVKKGLTGNIVGARSVFTTIKQSRPHWTAVQGEGGGVLSELASHEIDLTRFLFDTEIEKVFAESSGTSGNETVNMQLHLANGISVQGLFSLGSVEESRYEVYGKNIKLSVDRYSSWRLNSQGQHAGGLTSRISDLFGEISALSYGVKKLLSPENEPSYRPALEYFVEAIRHNHPVKPDIEDGFQVMAAIFAAEKSIKSGHPEVVDRY